jgi:peptide deformylase
MSGLVRRSKKIKYSGIDLKGEKVSGEADGLHARVIQHEFDHLNGILYTSRLADKRAFGYSEEIEKFWKKNDEEKSK